MPTHLLDALHGAAWRWSWGHLQVASEETSGISPPPPHPAPISIFADTFFFTCPPETTRPPPLPPSILWRRSLPGGGPCWETPKAFSLHRGAFSKWSGDTRNVRWNEWPCHSVFHLIPPRSVNQASAFTVHVTLQERKKDARQNARMSPFVALVSYTCNHQLLSYGNKAICAKPQCGAVFTRR